MKRHFISKDSQKFWSIESEGSSLIITSGDHSGEGQISQIFFESVEASERTAEWQIKQKTIEGYTESTNESVLKINKKKFSCGYEGSAEELAKFILNDELLPQLKHLVIGNWGNAWDSGPDEIIKMIIDNSSKFAHLESLFVGDMDAEECEISWIQHGDYSEMLKMLPNLRSFTMMGVPGNLGDDIDLPQMEEIEVICGGLPLHIVTQLKNAKLPNLKKLVLYMGVEDYGLECSAVNMRVLASKSLFPNLKHLGFPDSEEQNELLAMIMESDILPQLEILDMASGCMTDEGGQLVLYNVDKFSHLKLLDISFHYMTEKMMENLKELPFEIDVSHPQDPHGEYMFPMIME